MGHDVRAVAEALAGVVEEVSWTLDTLTEAQVADVMERACVELAAATAMLAERLPTLHVGQTAQESPDR